MKEDSRLREKTRAMIPTTPEVKSARHRLDGVLQSLVSRRHGSSPRGSESGDEGATAGATVAGGSTGHFDDQKDKKPPRKKRRKDDYDDGGGGGSYHHTYVMKLFDRSVDLAQFGEATPLYPIARAWIHNQPHGKAGRPAGKAETEKGGGGGGGKGDEVVDGVEVTRGSSGDVYRLPPPTESAAESGKR